MTLENYWMRKKTKENEDKDKEKGTIHLNYDGVHPRQPGKQASHGPQAEESATRYFLYLTFLV